MDRWHVTVNDIRTWTSSQKRVSEETLPLLVKKLLNENAKAKVSGFAFGDSIAYGGWDGTVEIESATEYIPAGKSGWEFGTNDDVKGKADDDYDKRTLEVDKAIRRETTFVFVTSRLWSKKEDWLTEKKKDGSWKDVCGINATDLADWLLECPAVHRWFARVIGKRVGEWDIEQAWNALSSITSHKLTYDFFLKNRDKNKAELLTFLKQQPIVLRVKAANSRDSYGFIIACLITDSNLSNKTLIIKDQKTWDELVVTQGEIILIPERFIPSNIGTAIQNGYSVILPSEKSDPAPAQIIIELMSREDRIQSIVTLGLSSEKADEIYRETKGSIEAIVRHHLLKPVDYSCPKWVDRIEPNVILTVFFAQEWDSNSEKDKELISELANLEYSVFEKHVIELSILEDTPVRLIGSQWQLISPKDTWRHISKYINPVFIDNFGSVLLKVVSEYEPINDLSLKERLYARVQEPKPRYSSLLRTGLCNSLALVVSRGEEIKHQIGVIPIEVRVGSWLTGLFAANQTVDFWVSLNSLLPKLAESSPDTFLEAIEEQGRLAEPPISILFSRYSKRKSAYPISHILWSLELLAWNPSTFSRTTLVLSNLANFELDDKYANSPINSLIEIFLGWKMNSCANSTQKITVLKDLLLVESPNVTWKLLQKLLLNKHRTSSGTYQPVYAQWNQTTNNLIPDAEYRKYSNEIAKILLEECSKDPYNKSTEVLPLLDSFTQEHKDQFISILASMEKNAIPVTKRDEILNCIREIIFKNRKFQNAGWNLDVAFVDQLEARYSSLDYNDRVKKYSYLFNDHQCSILSPIVYDPKDRDRHIKENRIYENLRINSLREIYSNLGLKGFERLADICFIPRIAGDSSADLTEFSEEGTVISWLKDRESLASFARGYIYSKAEKNFGWANTISNIPLMKDRELLLKFLTSLPLNWNTYRLVESKETELQNQFWDISDIRVAGYDADLIIVCVEKIAARGRFIDALDFLSLIFTCDEDVNLIDSSLIVDLLLNIASTQDRRQESKLVHLVYWIGAFIDTLQKRNNVGYEKIALIELLYYNLLRYSDFEPKYISKAIAKTPAFFVQLITSMFHPDDFEAGEEKASIEKIVIQQASDAWVLFNSISCLPGCNSDDVNSIDEKEVFEWLRIARVLLRDENRQKVGDIMLGDYFSRYKPDTDGTWPNKVVRKTIESLKSIEFEDGLFTAKQNSRGATKRELFEGGVQEIELSKKFKEDAQKLELLYPRTAKLLRRLSLSYDVEARIEDVRALARE